MLKHNSVKASFFEKTKKAIVDCEAGEREEHMKARKRCLVWDEKRRERHIRATCYLENCVTRTGTTTKVVNAMKKTVITWKILREIQKQKGRFLKYASSERKWVEVSDDVAREKVSFTTRDTKPKIV